MCRCLCAPFCGYVIVFHISIVHLLEKKTYQWRLIDSAHSHAHRPITFIDYNLVFDSNAIAHFSLVQARRAVAIKVVREAENFMHFPTSIGLTSKLQKLNQLHLAEAVYRAIRHKYSRRHVRLVKGMQFPMQTSQFIVSIAYDGAVDSQIERSNNRKPYLMNKEKMCYFEQSASRRN